MLFRSIPHIDAALAQLPIEQREAVMLRYLENRSQADIALLLHISQPTVSRRLEEGIAALRRRLGPQACFALPMLVVVPPPSLLASVGKMGLAGIGAPASGGAAVSAGGSFAASISGMPLLMGGAVLLAIAALAAWPRTIPSPPRSTPAPAVAPGLPGSPPFAKA